MSAGVPRSLFIIAILAGCSFRAAEVPLLMDPEASVTDAAPDGSTPTSLFKPAHVDPQYLNFDVGDLSGATIIDTSELIVKGSAGTMPGFPFQRTDDGLAVLSVKNWTVDKEIVVIGQSPLVVVASGMVIVSSTIHGEANQDVPGPGGSLVGDGKGGDGQSDLDRDPGGGGGGFGSNGATGGDGVTGTGGGGKGGTGGKTFDDSSMMLVGGASGGRGSSSDMCKDTHGHGGAGGGAIQISAVAGVEIDEHGGINVGGGGGLGGCATLDYTTGGGGGGSGGEIFLDSPMLDVRGILAANGGGGGGAGSWDPQNGDAGQSGNLGMMPAPGGQSASDGNGGAGGAGAASMSMAAPGATSVNGGGGGGGGGRIWMRGQLKQSSQLISPLPRAAQ